VSFRQGLHNYRGGVPASQPNGKLDAAYHKADKAIQEIIDLLAAA